MKEVLFFTHNLGGGGAEKAVRGLAAYFNNNPAYGIHARILVVYDDPSVTEQRENIIVLKNRSGKGDGKLKKAVNVLWQIKEVRKLKRELGIDTCVSFLPGADIINVFSKTGERQVVSMRNRESAFTPNIFKKLYTGVSLKRCDRIVAVSEVVRRDAIDFFGVPEDKIITIHNAIDDETASNDEDGVYTRFAEVGSIVVNVGRLSPAKRQDILLRAFARAKEAVPDLKLVIVGGGELKEKLEALVYELGIRDWVYFAGFKKDVGAYMRRGMMFVLSSDTEGMPNVVLEAMQNGLPVVATRCGAEEILDPDGTGETTEDGFVRGKYGLIAPTSDEEILARAMAAMAGDRLMREAYAKRNEKCLEAYTWERIAALWAKEL